MTPTEILTLAPLGALVVVFGLFPGILLDLIGGPVERRAPGRRRPATAIAVDPLLVALGLGLVVAIVAARAGRGRPRGPGDDGAVERPDRRGRAG